MWFQQTLKPSKVDVGQATSAGAPVFSRGGIVCTGETYRSGPPTAAYSRVTNPKRFRPLHRFMSELIGRLEGNGLATSWRNPTWCVQASGSFPDPSAAPILVSFASPYPTAHFGALCRGRP
jgi:hypothetical protein